MINQLFSKIKLRFHKERQLYFDLYPILGFYPKHISFYRQALVHSSLHQRNDKGMAVNNERLEFLGDAIIEAVVSDIVFHYFEGKREGFLTTTRSKLVQRDTLNKLAEELGLNRLVRISSRHHEDHHNCYVGGNAFEALVGAIYLDRGYKTCQWFLRKRILGRHINLDDIAYREMNFKSKLLEWSQKHRTELEFVLNGIENRKDDSPIFQTTIRLEGLEIGSGRGYSKKESQQEAAKTCMQRLRREPQLIRAILNRKADMQEKKSGETQPATTRKEAGSEKTDALLQLTECPSATDGNAIPQTATKPDCTDRLTETTEGTGQEKTRTRRARRKKSGQQASRAPKENGMSLTDKEAIINAAEEAAFSQHQ